MILRPPDYESGALTNWAIGPISSGFPQEEDKNNQKPPIYLGLVFSYFFIFIPVCESHLIYC